MNNAFYSPDPIRGLKHINQKAMGFAGRLRKFLREYAVVSLAIGVIIAQASKDFVDAAVRGIFMPFLKLILPVGNLDTMEFYIKNIKFSLGETISAFLTLLIIVIFLYFVVKWLIKQEIEDEKRNLKKEVKQKIEK